MVQQSEKKMLNEWLWQKHREALQWKNPRLGIAPDPARARMFAVVLKYPDAIFIENGAVNIVEAKLKPTFEAIGQLLGYKDQFPHTPEFSYYKNWPINMILVTTFADLTVVELASKKGIQYEVFNLDQSHQS